MLYCICRYENSFVDLTQEDDYVMKRHPDSVSYSGVTHSKPRLFLLLETGNELADLDPKHHYSGRIGQTFQCLTLDLDCFKVANCLFVC